jgi:outer membrane biogenesis lipoprotein LolB
MGVEVRTRAASLAAILLLAGCASAAKEAPTVAPPPRVAQRPIVSYHSTGLENVIGRTAAILEAQFGKAGLDVREGPARKLQFAGPACVLDAYLYPPKGGGEPIVTHLDARLPDGRDFDRASCVAALSRR